MLFNIVTDMLTILSLMLFNIVSDMLTILIEMLFNIVADIVGVMGTGVSRLACGVAQRGPNTAHLHQHKLKTLVRDQASRDGRQGAFSGTTSSGWLTRRRRV